MEEVLPYRKVKPHPLEKVHRNRNLYRYHLKFPHITYSAIGMKFGISRQRVSELIRRQQKEEQKELDEAG